MVSRISDTSELNNGVRMPWLGLGVWKVLDSQVMNTAVQAAVEAGYRSIDTAAAYKNEEWVGQAVKNCGLPRDQLFITTKVWNSHQGYDLTLSAFEESRRKLGLDYIDLYLIHWPLPKTGKFLETWKALEKLYRDGYVRAIGVCNFNEHYLQQILDNCEIAPMVDQVEFHPLLTQAGLREFCRSNRIQMEAWSPLMKGELNHPTLQQIADKHGKTPAQVVIRWDIQHGVVTIPKSVTPSRIRENADLFNFELSPEDMAAIDALNQNKRTGPDPDVFHLDSV